MKRRQFLQILGVTAFLAGCGGNETAAPVAVVPAAPNDPGLPQVGRFDLTGSFRFDAQGNLFETNPLTGLVRKLTPDGQEIWAFRDRKVLVNPVASAVDGQGRVWVLDRGQARLQLLDATGTALGLVGDGLMGFPQDVVIGDRVYVSDGLNSRVAIFDLGGTLQSELRSAQLGFARGMALDGQGRLHVTSSDFGHILVFNPDGSQAGLYGQGAFQHARGLAIRSSDGLIAVVDSVGQDLELFTSDLAPFATLRPDPYQPRDVEFGPDGTLYLTGESRGGLG